MANLCFVGEGPIHQTPLERYMAERYANRYAKQVPIVSFDNGTVISRYVLPAQPGEAVIDGINY